MKRFVLPILLALALPAFAADDCASFVLKGIRVGMPFSEFAALGLDQGETNKGPLRWSPSGSQWWKAGRRGELQVHVLQERESDNASPVIAAQIFLSTPAETSARAVLQELVNRWGKPHTFDERVSAIETSNAYGGFIARTTTYRTSWVSLECGIKIEATRTTDSLEHERPGLLVLMVSIDKITRPIMDMETSGAKSVAGAGAPTPEPREDERQH